MKLMVGLFNTYQDAEQALRELQNIGIPREQISIIARDEVLRERVLGEESQAQHVGAGAVGGTAVGGLGGLLIGLSAITIPGLGPIVTTGTILTAIGSTAAGAGIGAATGGIIGALTSAGIPEMDAHVYAESIRRSNIVVTAEAQEEQAQQVQQAFDRAHAVDVNARRDELQRSGWERFDATSEPA